MTDRRDLRQRVIALIENGSSVSEAGRSCHVPLRTAQRWAHKFKNYGECQRRYSTGRPHCSTREEDEAVRWVDERNSFRSANQIRAAANFPGSFRMVMIHLRDANIHCWRATSKEGLTDGQAVDRLAFATRLEGFRLGKRNLQWRNIHLFRLWITGDTFIVSQAPDMTLAISNDMRDWDDLAYHAGAGCHVLALAC